MLTDVQNGVAVPLLRPIDNRDAGHLRVALRQLTYTVGWYNLHGEESFSWRSDGDTAEKKVKVSPGLWSFRDLQKRVQFDDVELEVNLATGRIRLTIPEELEVKFSGGLLDLLGLDNGQGGDWLGHGKYTGDRPVNFSPAQSLRVHLDQLNTTNNFVDGAPTTLLTTVAIGGSGFGESASVWFEHPVFKRLTAGTVTELKLTIRDHNGKPVDNHGFPITALLELQ